MVGGLYSVLWGKRREQKEEENPNSERYRSMLGGERNGTTKRSSMNMILESLTCIEYVIMYPLPNNIIY